MSKPKNRQNDNKPKRVPVSGLRDIMTVFGKDKGFVYRWVTDLDERGSSIMKYKRGGWDFAPSETDEGILVIGEESVYKSQHVERDIVRLHTGGGKFSYLMRILKEYYDEDQKAKQDDIDAVEANITNTGSSSGEDFGQYGSVKISR